MGRLTIDEAIEHCMEKVDCNECGKEHWQLAKWLKELRQYRDAEEQGLLVRLPCKVGDLVWGIRRYKGVKQPQQGLVSEMYFLPDMSLQIVIKHVCRGKFGETVFLTWKEAEQALRERGQHGRDNG